MEKILSKIEEYWPQVKESEESCRLFHGRGGRYEGLKHITVDWFSPVLYVKFYEEDLEREGQLVEKLRAKFERPIVLHKRYSNQFELFGISEEELSQVHACELGLKYELRIGVNQNHGFFLDMREGKKWVKEFLQKTPNAKVLNLFAYTCSFSVLAKSLGAAEVHNVDVSKSFLEWGRRNHHLNDQNTEGIFFHKKDVLKSLGWLAKKGPYDLVIYDPPSFQKSRFAYEKDYRKVVKQLEKLVKKGGVVASCLNTPFEKSGFIVDLYRNQLQDFEYINTLYSPEGFEEEDKENGVKICVFQRR